MKEIWKPIKDFEGLYEVSTLGNVRSIDRTIKSWNGHKDIDVLFKGKILKQHITRGYMAVGLCKNGKMQNIQVHRLVAKTFIPNLNNKPQVNHIDGNKHNNKVENLEWCSSSENVKHSYRIGLRVIKDKQKEQMRKVGLQCGKKVIQKDKLGNIVKIFDSGSQASRELGISQPTISLYCLGKIKNPYGYHFEYMKVGEING